MGPQFAGVHLTRGTYSNLEAAEIGTTGDYPFPYLPDTVQMLFPRKCQWRQHRSQSRLQFHLHAWGFVFIPAMIA